MHQYDLYGTQLSIYEAANILENLLNLKFEERESSFTGVYLTTDFMATEKFKVITNLDPIDGEPAELDYPPYRTLLYISGTNRSQEIHLNITQQNSHAFTLLKSEVL
jgi:hypothetical protein